MRLLTFVGARDAGQSRRLGLLIDDTYVIDVNAAYFELLVRRVRIDRARSLAADLAPPDLLRFLNNGGIHEDVLQELSAEQSELAEVEQNSSGQRVGYSIDVAVTV